MEATRSNPLKKWQIILLVVLVAVAAGAGLTYLLTRPSQDDFQSAKTTQMGDATKARKALIPAVNDYLAAFKAAYNDSKSAEQATQKAKAQFDAFKKAEADATAAIDALGKSRIAFDGETGPALKQFKADYVAEVDFYAGLVESYADY